MARHSSDKSAARAHSSSHQGSGGGGGSGSSSSSKYQQQYGLQHINGAISSSRSQRALSQQQQQHHQLAPSRGPKFITTRASPSSFIRTSLFIVLIVALVLTSLALFSTNWLEAERRYYGSKFKKLGLWRMCFNSFSAPDDYQFRKFYVGCRWIFADEYKPIRKFLLPGAFSFFA